MSVYKVDDILLMENGDKVLVAQVSDNDLYVVNIDAAGSGNTYEGWVGDDQIVRKLSQDSIRLMISHRQSAVDRLQRGLDENKRKQATP